MGFLSHGGTPKSSKSQDPFSIETYGWLGDPPFQQVSICPFHVDGISWETWRQTIIWEVGRLTRGFWDLPSGYDIASSPWKDPPFLSSVNHLFRLGPSIPWQTVSHNQRVMDVDCNDLDFTHKNQGSKRNHMMVVPHRRPHSLTEMIDGASIHMTKAQAWASDLVQIKGAVK